MLYILKGILIGLMFGAPVGAIGAMTIHRTLTRNVKAGLITGFGSSVADCLYACFGAFGVTVVSDFMGKHEMLINALCGLLIMYIGVSRFFQTPKEDTSNCSEGYIKMFLSAFVLGIMNPVAVMSFLVAFAYLGISDDMTILGGIVLVLGVFLGTMIWWAILLTVVEHLKKKNSNINMKKMNQIFGVIFIIFALIVLIKTFILR